MRQSELCRRISDRSDIKPEAVKQCLETFSDVLMETTLVEGQDILTPFGRFSRKVFPRRKCHNPRTGRTTMTQETHSLSFSTRKKLKLHRMDDGTFAPVPSRRRSANKIKK